MSESPGRPVEPPPTEHTFDPTRFWNEDVVKIGADLEPGTLLAAYRAGVFPMGAGRHGAGPLAWWSPDPRGVLLPGGIRVSKSLRRSMRRFDVTLDADFEAVITGCAEPVRSGRWITPEIIGAYLQLHHLGWAHSIEVWREGDLVGGLYGVGIGGFFAGESMFHRETDASKVALVTLADMMFADREPDRFVDTQWSTRHLASLGVIDIPQADYLRRLDRAVEAPAPPAFVRSWRDAGAGGDGPSS